MRKSKLWELVRTLPELFNPCSMTLEKGKIYPANQLERAWSTCQPSLSIRGWLLQPQKSIETLWGTKELLLAFLSHCNPAIIQVIFWENDGLSGCRTCNTLNKWGKGGELHKSNSRPVYQRRLNGFKEKEQEVCAFTLICLHRGEDG